MTRVDPIKKFGQVLRLGLVLGILQLTACGPTVKNAVAPGQVVPRRLAFLPINAPEGMRVERVTYLRDAQRRELANSGIALLNDDVISKTCRSISCPERSELISRYGADGFFVLDIESASKNNALLGYVDQIHGTGRILDRGGNELFTVENRETETGGLLFNSGQVLEGIKSSLKNYGDDGFNLLAVKFSKSVALKLPPIQNSTSAAQQGPGQNSEQGQQRIDQVSVQTIKPETFKICLTGTPGGTASLSSGHRSFPLREVTPGRYCGTHWLESAAFGGGAEQPVFFGELRSSFGDVARKDVTVPLSPQCKWDDLFTIMQSAARNEIRYACSISPADGPASGAAGNTCSAGGSCSVQRYEVYRAARQVGPYQKVAEVKRSVWTDPAPKSGAQPEEIQYQLVAITADGGRSKPVAPKVLPVQGN